MTQTPIAPSGPGPSAQLSDPSGPLRHARIADSVRRVDPAAFRGPVNGPGLVPRSGDVVLARVDHVGDADRLDLATGRTCALFEGDEIVVAYGDDLSPARFEAYVPPNLGPCQLVATGGVAALVATAREGSLSPTRITPLGLLAGSDGALLNVSAFALRPGTPAGPLPPVIACVGTATDASAIQATSVLVRGLVRARCRVGVARVTAIASGSERWRLQDSGADMVVDPTDLGHVSTATLDQVALVELMTGLLTYLGQHLLDVIVIELASPVCDADSGTLIRTAAFAHLVDGAILAAPDAGGAVAGARLLERAGVPVIALTGTLMRSPLAARVAFSASGLACLRLEDLAQPRRAEALFMDVVARSIEGTE